METPILSAASGSAGSSAHLLVNDVHSRLNGTMVDSIIAARGAEDLEQAVANARRSGKKVCIAGGRHAMGSQQFAAQAQLIDTRAMNKVLQFDPQAGTVTVEAGIQWPDLIRALNHMQVGSSRPWGITQKQTGADRLSIGGALSANVHGRGLSMRPFVQDVQSFEMVDGSGNIRFVSREQNRDLFGLVIGGYGLFGLISSVTLRLTPRTKLRRKVEVLQTSELIDRLTAHVDAGARYGDFQFAIDHKSDDFLARGICSTYHPVDDDTPIPQLQKSLSEDAWSQLARLAHVDKTRAYHLYRDHYLATDGQIYLSDTHQLSTYLDDYHGKIDREAAAPHAASEVITEVYVPRQCLPAFLEEARLVLRSNCADVIYGTVRLIERDEETFLPWARQPYACIIFNLHTEHSRSGLEASANAFRGLIESAIAFGGSYYLTYHKYATYEQLLACYPRFPEFLRLKGNHDPERLFMSDWYRHYSALARTRDSYQ